MAPGRIYRNRHLPKQCAMYRNLSIQAIKNEGIDVLSPEILLYDVP